METVDEWILKTSDSEKMARKTLFEEFSCRRTLVELKSVQSFHRNFPSKLSIETFQKARSIGIQRHLNETLRNYAWAVLCRNRGTDELADYADYSNQKSVKKDKFQ
jgi:hypothetical protein